MTGFAKAIASSNAGRLSIEISAINKRFFEVNFSLPGIFFFLDHFIKKEVEKKISRGSIHIKFEFIPEDKHIFSFLPDLQLLKNFKGAYEKLAKDLGFNEKEITFEFLLKDEKLLVKKKIENEHDIKKLFSKTLNEALKKLIQEKKKEGRFLKKDIEQRINLIISHVSVIKKEQPDIKIEYENKFRKKIKNILDETSIDIEDRVLKEAAIYADKIDITEEIVRLDSHLKNFKSLINLKKETHGRELEFMLQEIGREINTISSKSSNMGISKRVIEIKSEIEKIKEQLQNIE
ncbi:MAG: YicC family protein [Chlamydiae bacterium RIFCSPLOWO2_01_FULL_28_7]|nr:MAG: YicC family protein [Chlamydiae bacterium RIFCSPLOWO2_01_FULL_28_7]